MDEKELHKLYLGLYGGPNELVLDYLGGWSAIDSETSL